jgi:hypothetical protein
MFTMIKYCSLLAATTLLLFYIPLLISANTDLIDGRFALFMDERITFDGVHKIINPDEFSDLLLAIFVGDDHRYGRSLWNSLAIASIIPSNLFGESGQIVASRMLQIILIFASYCIISFGVLRNWILRYTLLIVVLSIPFSAYFLTIPKPEPLQLLFVSIFFYYYIKSHAAFSWYWIFLGLAFGTKVLLLPILPIFAIFSLITAIKRDTLFTPIKSLSTAVFAFSIGLSIAIPLLLPLVVLCSIGCYSFYRVYTQNILKKSTIIIFTFAYFCLIFYICFGSIKTWLSSTIFNTTHGSDRASVNIFSWFDFFIKDWMVSPYYVNIVFIVLIFLYISIQYISIISKKSFFFSDKAVAIIILITGIFLNLTIMLFTNRLWGLYLFPGSIITIFGMLILIDKNISNEPSSTRVYPFFINRYLGYLIIFMIQFIAMFYWLPSTVTELRQYSSRTSKTEYLEQYSSYLKYTDFLAQNVADRDQPLFVMLSPWLFPPARNDHYEIVEFYGPFNHWHQEPDVIIFSKINTPFGGTLPKDSPLYNDFLSARKNYQIHVVAKSGTCMKSPCYQREMVLPNGGELLKKVIEVR